MDNVKQIVVIGSGAMGTGIAQNAVQSGFQVLLRDVNEEQLRKAEANIMKQLSRQVEKGKLTREEKEEAFARLEITDNLLDIGQADLIIEAASENLDVKKAIFEDVSRFCREDAILATNTSSISITKIASVVSRPERFVGMHFFNPVPVMRLLEIVRGLETSEQTVETARQVGVRLGKETIVSADSAGFIVNRLLDPMLNEMFDLVDRGVGTPEDVDKGCKFGLNWPMGPCELIDMAGIDILLAVMEVIYADTGDSKYRPSPLLRRMVDAGRLGRKTGRGFYDYAENR